KPDSVLRSPAGSIIYLGLPLLTGSSDLPVTDSRKREDNEQLPDSVTYLVFQPPGFTAMPVTRQGRRLLPHVFTLTPTDLRLTKRYIFCGTIPYKALAA